MFGQRTIAVFGSLMLIGMFANAANAGFQVKKVFTSIAEKWTGTFEAESGSVVSLVFRNGLIDGWGKDKASSYTIKCILSDVPKRNVAKCAGSGMSHGNLAEFVYSSVIILDDDGGFNENWTARFWKPDGSGIKEVSGQETFRRQTVSQSR